MEISTPAADRSGRFSRLINASNMDRAALSFLAILFLFRILYAHFLGLIPDETYYWDWSRELSWGYFDHPPMIAWLIYLSRHVFGETALGVRGVVVACSLAASICSYLLAKKFVSKPSSLVFFLIMSSSILLFGVGTILSTPDIPLILFWTCCLLYGYKGVFENSTAAWLMLGLCAGLGLLSKYTFVLFFTAFLLFILLSKRGRFWLFKWQPYAALSISFLVWLPNLVWNSRHHWVSFSFQFSHGIGRHASFRPDSLGEFVVGQIGILSFFPFVLLICACVALWKDTIKDSGTTYLALFLYVPFFVFLCASMQKKVEANWAATAYVSGLVFIAKYWEDIGEKRKNRFMRRFAIFSAIFAALTTTVLLFHIQRPFLPLAPSNDPASQVRGWKEWARDIGDVRNRFDPSGSLRICTNRYQEASMLGFYLPDHPLTYALCLGARQNSYALFQARTPKPFQEIIFIHPASDSVTGPTFSETFSSIQQQGVATLRQAPHSATPYNVYVAVLRKSL
jgi:4-amino-4-deoxy-L-arabinose transferase-like glycosyltransferase